MIYDTLLPEQFKSWIEFYDHLTKNIPGLKLQDNIMIVKFHLMKSIPDECDPYLKFNYTLGYIRAQCFIEIEDFRPSVVDLYHYEDMRSRCLTLCQPKSVDLIYDLLKTLLKH
jgi:hypothetical protein